MVRKLFLSILIVTFSMSIFAQEVKEVTLTVSGDGATKKEATDVALLSAIEQAFGVFVSANTTILNDELVKDEIAKLTSGNIKKYEEIASAILPNGNTTVTLKATVSVSKLITYAQSKGSSAEFAGETFAMNMKLKELNKTNEIKALENMIFQLEALIPDMFDYKIELGEPKINSKGDYDISAKVIVIFNDNTKIANNILLNTLTSLSLSGQEIEEYKKLGLSPLKYALGNCLYQPGSPDSRTISMANIPKAGRFIINDTETKLLKSTKGYYLRTAKFHKLIPSLVYIFSRAIYNFKIDANTGISSSLDIVNFDFESKNSQYLKKNGLINNNFQSTGYESIIYYLNYPRNRSYSGQIAIPHIEKENIPKYNGDLAPYIIHLTLTIPKNDIAKYSNFTITHK